VNVHPTVHTSYRLEYNHPCFPHTHKSPDTVPDLTPCFPSCQWCGTATPDVFACCATALVKLIGQRRSTHLCCFGRVKTPETFFASMSAIVSLCISQTKLFLRAKFQRDFVEDTTESSALHPAQKGVVCSRVQPCSRVLSLCIIDYNLVQRRFTDRGVKRIANPEHLTAIPA
jgi:hypothetical protein